MAVLFFLIGLWFIVGFYLGAQWHKWHTRKKGQDLIRILDRHKIKNPDCRTSEAFNETIEVINKLIESFFVN